MSSSSAGAIRSLVAKGVTIPAPETVVIDGDVDLDRISADQVTIHPGCRISGPETLLSAGVSLGAEGPVTARNARLGSGARVASGFITDSVLMAGAALGSGAHVREACLLEEHSSTAHCVGLKHTILMPYATLGSLINFCDCLLSGGTSRSDHSEVGSSYVHFNFTPEGDKSTPSLFGDVVHGVLLDQARIFLGGQGGAVGPVVVGFGAVVAAGSMLRSDAPAGKLTMVGPPPSLTVERSPGGYRTLNRTVSKNLRYLGELSALEAWYTYARSPFLKMTAHGPELLDGALAMIAMARSERERRLRAMVHNARNSPSVDNPLAARAIAEQLDQTFEIMTNAVGSPPEGVLEPLMNRAAFDNYLEAVQSLGAQTKASVVGWLDGALCRAWDQLPEALAPVSRIPRSGVTREVGAE